VKKRIFDDATESGQSDFVNGLLTEAHTRFLAELERLGEKEVRYRLMTNVYGNVDDHKRFVEEWLQDRDRARATASNSEMAATASRAAAAAERAATAAEEQARIAKHALKTAIVATAIASIALIVSILGVLHFIG
jgi:hypothetical protein